MKPIRFTPLLLTLLLLTGCGKTAPQPAEDEEDDIIVLTDAPTETTEEETEATTELPTETETEAPETTEAAPLFDDPEEQLWYNIREVLIPEYGLSDTDYFDPEQGEKIIAPPESTQGIISACVRDFFGDETPELLLIRSEGYELLCDLYTLADDGTCEQVDETQISTNEDNLVSTPSVHIVDGCLILRNSYYHMPNADTTGDDITVLDVTKKGFVQTAYAGAQFADGTITFRTAGEDMDDADETTYATSDIDYNGISYDTRTVLEEAGLEVVTVRAAYPGGGFFRLEAELTGEDLLFMVDNVPDSGMFFLDNTGLREALQDGDKTTGKKQTKSADEEETEEETTDTDETALSTHF